MPAPSLANPAAMATTTVTSALQISYQDGSQKEYQLAYAPFFMTGATVPDGKGGTLVAGGNVDSKNQPIYRNLATKDQYFSSSPDGSSLLQLPDAKLDGIKGKPVFAVVQFESTSGGQLPSPIAVLTLDQDQTTGKLDLVKYHNVDTSAVHGLWVTCGASLSPWNTHLSSEEYPPDAFTPKTDAGLADFGKKYFGPEGTANPYHYGHMPEVTVNPDGSGTIAKHYCMGRISHELVQVMPDQRTTLMGDDTTNGGLFMFIADKAADLSAGTLYVAKWKQTSPEGEGTGSATLTWINLGHATSQEISDMADTLKPQDIMDVQWKDPMDSTYTHIRYSGSDNWVKVKDGKEKAATFLETHRFAALKGASMGFTKMEGTTVNIKDKIAYSAMSSIGSSMTDGTTDIKVKKISSGAVYALPLQGGQVDQTQKPIDSEWVPVSMAVQAGLISEDLSTPDALGNTANADKIANPDNLKFSEKLRTLFIGEDSGTHVNNFLWAYNVDSKKLERILSCPVGAESTGLHAVDDINGWTYIMSNFQHAGAWGSDIENVQKALAMVDENYDGGRGASVGYLTADLQGAKRG